MTLREEIEAITYELAIGITSRIESEKSFTITTPPTPEEATDLILQAIRERVPSMRSQSFGEEYLNGFNSCRDQMLNELE